jgi:hypothetical protein
MYFAEQAQTSSEELAARSLDLMREHYSSRDGHYSLRDSLPFISEAFASDDELTEYLLGFHANGRVVTCLQLQGNRPEVANSLAGSLQEIDSSTNRTVNTLPELAYIQSPSYATEDIEPEYAYRAKTRGYDLQWPTWVPNKVTRQNPPCDNETWSRLRKATSQSIARSLIALSASQNDKPESYLMQAAVCLVSGKKTAVDPRPDGQPAHMPILTAPSRLEKAHDLLCMSGVFYERGALSIAGALARADQVEQWDIFQSQVRRELAAQYGDENISGPFVKLSVHAGVEMAMRQERHDVVLAMTADELRVKRELGSSSLRALCTIVHAATSD